ncbi:homeodomain-interacting protein kinase 1-like [Hippoglossus stenolepis]|uniref:homeodomain-interacting protein kinase 1-like n=1 Tax=Hippoglossus stenolepis TaxID=195615 RepID=UPI001FB01388|nr:homeodomain-interacting protein kinase 1-like [Hippoglossus stenolepis]
MGGLEPFVAQLCFTITVASGFKMSSSFTDMSDKPLKPKKTFRDRVEKFSAADADRSHIIVHDEPTCPSFEVVDVTLDEYLKDVKFMTISEIRPVLQQLATALLCLEDLDIVHSDIKPENIMVLDKWQKPLQVKLIEFGLARQGPDIHPGSGGQSLLYRAPEVMLGLRHRQPIDMWSVGLTVAEMALGRPLLPGKHEYDIVSIFLTDANSCSILDLFLGS